jgi:hypothetical protein
MFFFMKINYLKKIMMITIILVSNNYLIRKINYSIQNRNFIINILRPISDYIYIINFFKTILNLHLEMVTSFLNNVIYVLMEMGYKEIRFL